MKDSAFVMAARERQCDEQAGIPARWLSWPAVVLAGGVLLSLAANLDQVRRRRGRRCGRAVRAGTAVPGARGRGRGAARRGRGAPHRCAPGRRRAPGPARAADHPRRAPRLASPTRPPPSCCAGSAPARACRREPPAPLDLAASPPGSTARWARRRAVGAARQAPRRRGNLPGPARRPRAGRRPAPTRPVRSGPPAAGAEGRRPRVQGGWGRSAEMADRLSGFANLSPFHVDS